MTDYTIVEPGFEFMNPTDENNYLEFLEKCTRVCYKSEDKIAEGSAEKLMNKVVKEYEHYSVTEHVNGVFALPGDPITCAIAFKELTEGNPLIRKELVRISEETQCVIMSGNIRMWTDFMQWNKHRTPFMLGLRVALYKKWPFFFKEYEPEEGELWYRTEALDENPLTNKDNLAPGLVRNHMTLTYKIICDRSTSHQLVRHRMFAFSQESQRYCNYGKKGFQIIVPPKVIQHEVDQVRDYFVSDALKSYDNYLNMIKHGIKPEDARGLLPNCTKTEVVTTGTIAYWRHVFRHRADNPKAQWQIRQIMQGIQDHARAIVPEIL